jgi:hypothetical protein
MRPEAVPNVISLRLGMYYFDKDYPTSIIQHSNSLSFSNPSNEKLSYSSSFTWSITLHYRHTAD